MYIHPNSRLYQLLLGTAVVAAPLLIGVNSLFHPVVEIEEESHVDDIECR